MAMAHLILQLEGAAVADENIVVDRSPFTVGRNRRLDAHLSPREISAQHCRFEFDRDTWWVTDLHSTNGTYVNGQKIQAGQRTQLSDGDFLSLAKRLYRIALKSDGLLDSRVARTVEGFDSEIIRETLELIQILGEQRTYPYFQPIVALGTRQTIGWEALGRASSRGGPIPIVKLFDLARQQGRETDLSLCLRDSARACAECRHCWPNRERAFLFFNLHPAEIYDEQRLLQSLRPLSQLTELRQWYRPVAEMPESWVSNVEQMRRVMGLIRDLDLLVAYDDFGRGQARLEDLVKTPPDFVKLDRRLIVDLGGERSMYRIVSALVDTCRELKVLTIGEGIETPDELQACLDLGMDLGQGYLFESPAPAFQLFGVDATTIPGQRPQCPFVRLKLIPR